MKKLLILIIEIRYIYNPDTLGNSVFKLCLFITTAGENVVAFIIKFGLNE